MKTYDEYMKTLEQSMQYNGEKLLKRAKLLATKGIGTASHGFLFELGTNISDPSDQHLLINGSHGVSWDGERGNEFCVFRIMSDPGVMYHPDGSGTPPSEDIINIASYDSFDYAFKKAFGLAVGHSIEEFLEYEEANRLADELED